MAASVGKKLRKTNQPLSFVRKTGKSCFQVGKKRPSCPWQQRDPGDCDTAFPLPTTIDRIPSSFVLESTGLEDQCQQY